MGWSPRITLAESSAGDAVIRHLFTRGLNNEQGMQQYLIPGGPPQWAQARQRGSSLNSSVLTGQHEFLGTMPSFMLRPHRGISAPSCPVQSSSPPRLQSIVMQIFG